MAPDDYLELYTNYVVMLSEYCQQRGITFLYVNTPSKEFVYDEYVPSYVHKRLNVYYYIEPVLEDSNVEHLDLTDSLRKAKEEGTEVFHTFYDPGHFNTAGAFVASNAILERLGEMGVNVEQADLSDYYVEEKHVTNLPASVYPLDMYVDRYVHVEDGTEAVDQVQYKQDLDVSAYSTDVWNWVNPSVDSDADLLMFQGSYFCSQGTSMYNQFPHAALVRAYCNVLAAQYYIDVFQPNVVVFEAADYTIRDGYYNTWDLTIADLPPVFSDTYSEEDFQAANSPIDSLSFSQDTVVANFLLPCDTQDIKYAYVQMGGIMYECVVRENGLFWGTKTEKLSESQTAWVYLVGSDGYLQKFNLSIEAQ